VARAVEMTIDDDDDDDADDFAGTVASSDGFV